MPPQKKKSSAPSKKVQKANLEKSYVVAKKIMRHYGLDTGLVDVFTNKQRERLLRLCYDEPDVKVKKEKTVPRQFVRSIVNETYQHLINDYWGDPENDLLLMELATFGISFLGNLSDDLKRNAFTPNTPQEAAAKKIFEAYNKDYIIDKAFEEILANVWYKTRCYSRVTYRMYGFEYDVERKRLACGCCFKNKLRIRLTAQNSETKVFSYNNIKRKAYRIYKMEDGYNLLENASVERNKIFPKTQDEEKMDIYIQSHVLHRFKERMDIFSPSQTNLMIQYAFSRGMNLAKIENRVVFECQLENELPVGYFTFFVNENDVVINTILPMTSENTPLGKKLYKSLRLSKDEIVFLGMDKISFLMKIDFEEIPALKQALIDSGIWEVKMMLERLSTEDKLEKVQIDKERTKFVKHFFDKKCSK